MSPSSSALLRSGIRLGSIMEITRIKELLGVPVENTSQDVSLTFIADIVEETVLNYCNLDKLPDGLKNTCLRMAVDLYRYEKPTESGVPLRVASITEGDTATSFSVLNDVLKGTILKDYKGQLNRYRRMRHD